MNRFKPHLLVLPEDDANRQIVVEFLLHPRISESHMQVLRPPGGWLKVLEAFRSTHLAELERYRYRCLVLLIDFDGDPGRIEQVRATIPQHLRPRVFILGASTEREAIRRELGSYETIGRLLAEDCIAGTDLTWSHGLLRHNAAEAARLREHVRDFLFTT